MFGWRDRKTAMHVVRELMTAKKWEDAILKLDELVVKYPRDTDLALHRGFGLRQMNRFAEALVDLQRVQRTFDEDSGLWELLGDTLLNLKRYEEALKPLSRSLQLTPDRLTARLMRATCYQSLGRNREALTDCVKYLAGAPYDKSGYLLKAMIHEGMYEPEAGLAAVRTGLILAPTDAGLLAIRARLLIHAGQPEAALEAIEAATAAGQGSADLELRRLDLLLLLDRFSEALPLLHERIQEDPSRSWYLRRSRALAGLGEHDKAAADRQAAARRTQELLIDVQRTGILRTATLIQAGLQLFAAGSDDGNAEVLLTFDDSLNSDLIRMQRIATVLAELKNKSLSKNSALRAPASAVRIDSPAPYGRQTIPLKLTAGVPCYTADLILYREYLPEKRLTPETRFLAVVAEPGDTGRIELLPNG